jgi:hypothetical protein
VSARRRRALASLVLVTGVLGACGAPRETQTAVIALPPPPPQAASIDVRPDPPKATPRDPAADATAALQPYALSYEGLQRTFYTWTTQEQLADLAKSKQLLVRSRSASGAPSYYQRVVGGFAASGDDVARILADPAFSRVRFAWPHAWPTSMGVAGESYGDEIVRVTLQPGAWIVPVTDAMGSTGEGVTVMGGHVTRAELVRTPERIGAVYFVHEGRDGTPPYREFVLVNEHMVESFSAKTPELAAELEAEASALDVAAGFLRGHAERGLDRAELLAAWKRKEPYAPSDARAVYAASLALFDASYQPEAANVSAIAARLRAVARAGGTPLAHEPKVPAPQPKPPPAPPPPPRGRLVGTMWMPAPPPPPPKKRP